MNSVTKEEIVEVLKLKGEEYLFYKYPHKIDVALIRGTTADMEGYLDMFCAIIAKCLPEILPWRRRL